MKISRITFQITENSMEAIMSRKVENLNPNDKTRHGEVTGQSTKTSSDNKEFDVINFNINPSTNQLNRDVPQLPPEACVPEELGLGACTWLDDFCEFGRIWSPESYDGYIEGGGLSLLSTVAAGRVVFDLSGQRKTNLNILLIGRTSVHAKSTATNIAKDLLNVAGLDWLLAPDEITPQKLIADMSSNALPDNFKSLSDQEQQRAISRTLTAGQRGWFVDEFGDNITAMMQPNGVMTGIKGLIRTLDGAPLKYEYCTVSRDRNLINNPYLPILGNVTIADLAPYAKQGNTLWGDGFFARFATPTPPLDFLRFGKFPNHKRKFPDSLISPLVNWNIRLGFPEYEIAESKGKQILKFEPLSPKHLKISDVVYEAYYEYHNALRVMIVQNQNHDLDGNYARFPEKALRVAALFASFENSGTIQLKHWAKAQAIVERWRTGLHEFYRQVMDTNGDQVTKYVKDLPVDDQILRAIVIKLNPNERAISQFTGLNMDIVRPALGKLVSNGKVLIIPTGTEQQYILPSVND